MSTGPEHWREQLRPLFDGRRVIVKQEVVAGSLPAVRAARELGATDVLVVATNGTGTGPLPAPEEAEWCSFDLAPGGDMVSSLHAANAAIADPPPAIVERIERFDPDRTALVVADFLNESPQLCGRRFLAYRRPEWLALDDKTVIDAFWDRCGIERAPSEIVEATVDTVVDALARIDRGDGVVVNADATTGWTGGGSGVRWAGSVDDVAAALHGWDGPGRRVRVMPFLEGIPCSVHGIVFADHVIALRPVEMVTLRLPDRSFFYAGCATFWDPPPHDREEMRSIARTVGACLRVEVEYRGAFTIDGVMTIDGFRPTELNPRNGAGLNLMSRANEIPLQFVLDALVGGVPGDWRPAELEHELLASFDANRIGGTWRPVPVGRDPVADRTLTVDDVDATYMIGPSPLGAFVRAMFDADTFPPGRPAGPYAAKVWEHLNRLFDLGLPPLNAARDVRRPP